MTAAPLDCDASITHRDASAVGRLISGDETMSITWDMADGFTTLGPWSTGDQITVSWADEARTAIMTRFRPSVWGSVTIEFVWADDIAALDAERTRALELVGLWAGVRRDALANAAAKEGVASLAERLGITRSAIYKALAARGDVT